MDIDTALLVMIVVGIWARWLHDKRIWWKQRPLEVRHFLQQAWRRARRGIHCSK